MIQFSSTLKKEVDKTLAVINAKDVETLVKASEVTLLLGKAFERLRNFIHEYTFKDEDEEILFFKEIKPDLFYNLIYYRKMYNLEMNRPTGGDMELKCYLEKELFRIKDFFDRNRAFYRYYRLGETGHDRLYFLRGRSDNTIYQDSMYYERDPKFSTCCDLKVAKVMANNLVEEYVLDELAKLGEQYARTDNFSFPKVKLTWTANKVFLVELIYALASAKVFNNGKATLKEIVSYFECIFNIDLGTNPSRTFSDLAIRKNRTSFLDRLRELLNDKMDEKDESIQQGL